jgi:ketosteroid isomerase-like protein
MAQATSEFVHRFFRALDQRDQPALLDLVNPDVEFASLIQEVEGRFRGHVGLRQYLRELYAAFAEWKVWAEEIQELGSAAVVKVHVRATSSAGGVPADFTDWQAIALRDGRASWWAFFRTEAEALEAARARQ